MDERICQIRSDQSNIAFRKTEELGSSGALTHGAWPLWGTLVALRGSPCTCPAAGPAARPVRHTSGVNRSSLGVGAPRAVQRGSVGDQGRFHPWK